MEGNGLGLQAALIHLGLAGRRFRQPVVELVLEVEVAAEVQGHVHRFQTLDDAAAFHGEHRVALGLGHVDRHGSTFTGDRDLAFAGLEFAGTGHIEFEDLLAQGFGRLAGGKPAGATEVAGQVLDIGFQGNGNGGGIRPHLDGLAAEQVDREGRGGSDDQRFHGVTGKDLEGHGAGFVTRIRSHGDGQVLAALAAGRGDRRPVAKTGHAPVLGRSHLHAEGRAFRACGKGLLGEGDGASVYDFRLVLSRLVATAQEQGGNSKYTEYLFHTLTRLWVWSQGTWSRASSTPVSSAGNRGLSGPSY